MQVLYLAVCGLHKLLCDNESDDDDDDDDSDGDDNHDDSDAAAGYCTGLNLVLNIEMKEYVGNFTEAGIRVAISDAGEMPFPLENGLSAAPGFSTSVGLVKVGQSPSRHQFILDYDEVDWFRWF